MIFARAPTLTSRCLSPKGEVSPIRQSDIFQITVVNYINSSEMTLGNKTKIDSPILFSISFLPFLLPYPIYLERFSPPVLSSSLLPTISLFILFFSFVAAFSCSLASLLLCVASLFSLPLFFFVSISFCQ
jgi:hypothetical protein